MVRAQWKDTFTVKVNAFCTGKDCERFYYHRDSGNRKTEIITRTQCEQSECMSPLICQGRES